MQKGHDLCIDCETNPVYVYPNRNISWCSECIIDTMEDVKCIFCAKLVAAWTGKGRRGDNICCENCVVLISLDAAKRRLVREQKDKGFVETQSREIERATQRFQPKRGRKEDE
jgi:hypothetical protein